MVYIISKGDSVTCIDKKDTRRHMYCGKVGVFVVILVKVRFVFKYVHLVHGIKNEHLQIFVLTMHAKIMYHKIFHRNNKLSIAV